MHCFHWNRQCNRPYNPRVGCKSRRVGRKSAGKWWVRIHITLYKPPSTVICHSFHTSKMTGTHQEQLIDHLGVVLVFIESNFLLYFLFSRHRRQQNPAPAQPTSPSPPPPPPRRRRKPQNPWVLPWIIQRREVATEHSWTS